METCTMTCNKNNHKWFTSFNNGNGACGVHWKDVNKDWKQNKGKKKYLYVSNYATNAVIYFYYLMATSEKSTEEEKGGGDENQDNNFISMIIFEIIG